jgi:hypothetical protein
MIPALIVGALTAWYLGLRTGIIVAIAVFVAVLVAAFVPGASLAVYALVIAWAGALYFLGPKLSKRTPGLFNATGIVSAVGGAANQAKTWANKFLKRNGS